MRLQGIAWELIKLRVDVVYTVLASIAILIGAIWAIYTFVAQREAVWNLEMTLATETLTYIRNLRLLILRVGLANKGKRKIIAGKNGLVLNIMRLPTTFRELELLPRIGANVAGATTVVKDFNMLGHYTEYYQLEPGAKYVETEAVISSEGECFLIRLEFFGDDDSDVITSYYFVAASASSPYPRQLTGTVRKHG
jgi:hypothetical protein